MTGASDFGGHLPASTNSGQDNVPDLLVNPLDTEGVHRLNESAQKFTALAKGGGFAVNEAGFQAYNKVCDDFLHGYTDIQQNFYQLLSRAKMGSSDYSHQVADFNVKVAGGDPQSLIPNLELLRESIKQVQQALQIARDNYREADSAHAQTFRSTGEAS
ncbi:hypothetical protein [Amycolatopsis sp. DSM 110486]|uniref:hypothetical protein n=1 Tax=Amycolatopsis sp. DSM 110486 TaxID=2865832 RepID=UPI001C6A79B1|nr:hypothetical protein [Amycolatopsis sp. DSM 110486]QYN23375.1 hypothetical protein K1T34_13515 [Amycolatopsis sp. DSM 110486]